ncbi:MAG: ATP-binding protein [Acidimicrobiales bacterium]
MSWSSGKDSAYALEAVRHDSAVDVTGLLVTLNGPADRVAMHAVRRTLLEAQADRLDLPLHLVEIPSPCPNEVYEAEMAEAMRAAGREGVETVVFGDLFLGDVRAYREQAMAGTGVSPLFPLWGRPTGQLAREIIASGVRAVLTCVDPQKLPAPFAGRAFDHQLLADLPPEVDPCGERGEFHTFVWDAPRFASPIPVRTGEIVTRDGFVFCDVVPGGGPGSGSDSRSGEARSG